MLYNMYLAFYFRKTLASVQNTHYLCIVIFS